jgi:hypothetical protein
MITAINTVDNRLKHPAYFIQLVDWPPRAVSRNPNTAKGENAVRNVKVFGLAVLAMGLLSSGVYRAGDKDSKDSEDPKYTIKQVMKMAHGKADKSTPTLAEKVLTGKASKDEQTKLLELYTALAANKPPKGDPDAWKEKATAITTAIKDVIDAKDDADVNLRKAMNCRGCHTSHRGK